MARSKYRKDFKKEAASPVPAFRCKISIDKKKQPPYTSIHRKQYLIKSEVTRVTVIANPEKGIKMLFPSPRLYPDLAVLDPRMTKTSLRAQPRRQVWTAMAHVVEAYSGLQKNSLSDAMFMPKI